MVTTLVASVGKSKLDSPSTIYRAICSAFTIPTERAMPSSASKLHIMFPTACVA